MNQICKDLKPQKNNICAFYDTNNGLCKLDDHYRCLEDVAMNSIQLSHSTVQNYTRCKRLCWYKDIMGKILKTEYISDPLKTGTLWGKAQHMVYNTRDKDDNPIETPETLKQYHIESKINLFSLAKVKAVYRVYSDLIEPDIKDLIGLEQHFSWEFNDADPNGIVVARIHGYFDRLYSNYFVECKFTKNKSYYDNVFAIQSQCGTYFLGNPNLEYVIMEVIQIPDLRPLQESKKREFAEEPEEYENRMYAEILRVPSNVFIGLDRSVNKFGMKFWRKEFDLQELIHRYKWITQEIRDTIRRNSWYIEDKNCFMYGSQCEYYNICSNHGYADENMFETRNKDR